MTQRTIHPVSQVTTSLTPSRNGRMDASLHHDPALARRAKSAPAVPRPATNGRRQTQWRLYIAALFLADATAIALSLYLAYALRLSSGLITYRAAFDPAIYERLVFISLPIWLAIFVVMGLYRRDNLLGGVFEYKQLVKACFAGVIAMIIFSFSWREFAMISRGWVLLSLILSIIFLGWERFFMRRVAYWLRRRGWLSTRALIVGANEQSLAMAEQWMTSPTSGMEVVGFLDDFKPVGSEVAGGLKVLGRPSQLAEIASARGVEEVILTPNAMAWESFETLITETGGDYTVRLSPGFYEIMATGVAVTNKSFVPLFTVHKDRLVDIEALIKITFDLGLGFLLALITLPLMATLALALKIAAPDQPWLRRYRTFGQGGKLFDMFKFRSRHHPAPASWGERLESFLYRTGLDKLPQLFHVLRGQMSLVGPRPRVLGQEDYDPRTVRYLQSLKPGCTGPWATTRHRNIQEEIRNDFMYVRNWTIWLDIQFLFQTFTLMLRQKGHLRPLSPPVSQPTDDHAPEASQPRDLVVVIPTTARK